VEHDVFQQSRAGRASPWYDNITTDHSLLGYSAVNYQVKVRTTVSQQTLYLDVAVVDCCRFRLKGKSQMLAKPAGFDNGSGDSGSRDGGSLVQSCRNPPAFSDYPAASLRILLGVCKHDNEA
jgi:hypothetical protein